MCCNLIVIKNNFIDKIYVWSFFKYLEISDLVECINSLDFYMFIYKFLKLLNKKNCFMK